MNDTESDAQIGAMLRQLLTGGDGSKPALKQDEGAIEEAVGEYLKHLTSKVSARHVRECCSHLRSILRDQRARAITAGERLDFISDLSVQHLNE